ncbi:MAG: hypothetical protein PHZ27_01310 [Candidatus Omnitrophica bacterium]|nr:hypothetical protein [Candidatus Omnitrophota bacterium]MDD5440832.1 hypothetical protein [Candidatus Omnitrophota bacterium]
MKKSLNILLYLWLLSIMVFMHTITYAGELNIEYKILKSEHFILQYEKDVSDVYVMNIKTRAERYYRQITQEFGFVRDSAWVWDNRTKITVFKNAETYKNVSGCYEWSAACVNYQGKEMYTFDGQNDFDPTLKHELTHIIFREYIGFASFPLWLDEGMAMYIQYMGSSKSGILLDRVEEDIKNDQYIPFSKMQSISTLKDDLVDVSEFYRQSYSMINFLIKKFGKYHFKEFLRCLRDNKSIEDSLVKAFSMIDNIKDFESLWKRYYQK